MFKRSVLLPLLLALAACSVNIPNLEPPKLEQPQIAEGNDLGLSAILALQIEVNQLGQQIYEDRARGTDYSEDMRKRLERLTVLNRMIGEQTVSLYRTCAHEPEEIVRACADYTRAVFKTAELSDELYGLLLGYTIAGLEKNPAFLTKENERLAIELVLKQREWKEAEAEPLRRFADALREGTHNVSPSPEGERLTSPSVVFSGDVDGEANTQLADAIREASKDTVLTSYPDITVTLTASQLDFQTSGDQFARVGAIALFAIPVAGLPGSGGDATIAATVSQNGDEQIDLKLNTYLINARDPDALVQLVANRIVGAAHFALLRREMAL